MLLIVREAKTFASQQTKLLEQNSEFNNNIRLLR